MSDKKVRKVDAIIPDSPVARWPAWGRWVVSLVLLFHIVAILAGALAAPPASRLEQDVARAFAPYHQLIDQGYGYRYYAPEPGPTPVVTATVHFRDGRPDETLRIPERGVLPRLRYQRQLALANHLAADFSNAKKFTGDGTRSHYARSYARHIGLTKPGSASVTLFVQVHFFPGVDEVGEGLARADRKAPPPDLDSEEFFTAPERIGDFPCDGS